ncbi:MAG: hypothetical protein IKK17_01175 [Oscillospiraceae bacterium]|nr:hypothetical protein [Oscillospiraceae bacterium]
MKRERIEGILFAVLACVIVVCSLLLYTHKDLTGTPYKEIAAYMEANPHKRVTYSVEIYGGGEPLVIDENTKSIVLTHGDQCYSMAEQAALLPADCTVLLEFSPTEQELLVMLKAFPEADLVYSKFTLEGKEYAANSKELNLSDYTYGKLKKHAEFLNALPALESILLVDSDGQTVLTLDEVLELQKLCPDLLLRYKFELFGKIVTTDMERLDYVKTAIRDSGLDEFRRVMPIMKKLTHLQLDTCKTSDVATAKLREDLAPQCKVVWRVFFGNNDALTDTYKIWATWNLNSDEVALLKYFNEVKYIDLGHNHFTNLDFMNYMPDLEMAIVALNELSDISGIANCKKLEYLEIFTNNPLTDEDMVHLSGLTNMKYLNVSNLPKLRSLAFTDNMPNLRWLWCTMSYIPKAEVQRVKELHPDCIVNYIYFTGDPTDYGWRYTATPKDQEPIKSSVYTLVRARFGYDTWDFSKDGKGHLREEITFESLGLTPP